MIDELVEEVSKALLPKEIFSLPHQKYVRAVGISVHGHWSHSPTLITFTSISTASVVEGAEVEDTISIS